MNGSENPYEILGVSPDADEAAIKKAYHQAARIHHPDKQTKDEDRERASAYFAKIVDAYSLLYDPVRRYDWRMSNGDKLERSPQNPSSPSKSTKSTATMNHRVPSTSMKRQRTPHVPTSGPKRRSSNQSTGTTPFAPAPRLRRRHSINTTECKQSPPVARKPAAMRRSNTIPRRSMTDKKNRSPRPEAGRKTPEERRKKRSSKSVPSTNKKLERKLSGASTESKRKGRTAARHSLDTMSQHTSRTVKSDQVPKQSKFGRARKLMRGWSKKSVSTESTSSTISMRSADNSIPTSLDTKSQHTSRTVTFEQVPEERAKICSFIASAGQQQYSCFRCSHEIMSLPKEKIKEYLQMPPAPKEEATPQAPPASVEEPLPSEEPQPEASMVEKIRELVKFKLQRELNIFDSSELLEGAIDEITSLPREQIKEYLQKPLFPKKLRPKQFNWVRDSNTYWVDLPSEVREAAEELGYVEESWNQTSSKQDQWSHQLETLVTLWAFNPEALNT